MTFPGLRSYLSGLRELVELPKAARAEYWRDQRGLPSRDPGPEAVVRAGFQWLALAQDSSTTRDGGVARHFSLITGWGASYPETTGYLIPTFLAGATHLHDESLRERARRALDWLVSIQFPGGGFQGGDMSAAVRVPVTFNTGQILLGLASGVEQVDSRYSDAMRKAANWLVQTQDPDGAWRKHGTPFLRAGERSYETHVAWGLLEAARLEPHAGYAEAAMANIAWALGNQRPNGWFESCCLSDHSKPLTHTIGYVLRGLIEGYRYSGDPGILRASRLTADALLGVIRNDGFLPGRLDHEWKGAVTWACLTGTVQIALCWFLLFGETGDTRYLEAGRAANRFVRRTVWMEARPEIRGAVKGSFPIHGEYGHYEYLNWSTKFLIDSCLMELHTTSTAGTRGDRQ